MTDGPVQPAVHILPEPLLGRGQLRVSGGSHQLRMERSVFLQLYLYISGGIAGRLHHMGSGVLPVGHGDMLMARQQQVEGKLLAQTAALVFIRGAEAFAGAQILFQPAVVQADKHVHLTAQLFCQRPGRLYRVGQGEAGQIFRFFPKGHPVGHQPDNAHSKAVTSTQWFVKMEPLARPAIEAVRSGQVQFVPERFSKTYFNWMENIRDWCISRQLWWGHRIPAYYCDECGETVVSKETPEKCPKCGCAHLHQDEDVLDTWFSSALWPFSTLGWPEQTADLNYWYPTSVMVTGYDIIFFWVARMIFSGLEHMGDIPFNTVLFHGLVRDAQGRKMSKSLGNGIDPLEIIDQYGADALRFTLATGNTPGNDMRFSDEKVIASRNFANKIWNASRFVLMNLKDEQMDLALPLDQLAIEDKWVLTKYNTLVKEVTDNLEKFELGIAVSKLYDFIWDVFCDWYVELAKSRLWEDGAEAEVARKVLVYVMGNPLKLLHPFMPFITEEIWQALPHEGESIMVSQWPVYEESLNFAAEQAEFEKVMDAIKAVRARRSEMNVPPSKKATLYIETASQEIFNLSTPFLTRLAWADEIILSTPDDPNGCVQVITDSAKVYMPLSQLVDRDKEIARLTKEKQACEKDIAFLSGKLNNPGFVAKAPEKVINDQRAKLEKAQELLAKIESSLAAFNN